jgi:hypothetical protein
VTDLLPTFFLVACVANSLSPRPKVQELVRRQRGREKKSYKYTINLQGYLKLQGMDNAITQSNN